jgi:acyclic terpene utilization AtuA family protein
MTTVGEIRVLSATSVCGAGFLESSLEAGLALDPHFIGCDGGSTDPGPRYLATGPAAFPRAAVKRDLKLMLCGARRRRIPLIIGSAGTAGGDPHVDWMCDILREITVEEGLSFRLAVIRAEQDKGYIAEKLRQNRITPLYPAPAFDESVIERSARIVGMMGAEPFMRALRAGADVIIAGRASDTAIFAALPVMQGIPAGIAWHAGKILECGAAAVVNRKTPDCMFAWLRQDHFVIEALHPEHHCTPQSIASHALYENADPFHLVECSGTVDLTEAKYFALNDRAVKVVGSKFIPADRYTVKLEGAELVGYMSVLYGSVRDPFIIRQVDDWIGRLRRRIEARVEMVFGERMKPGDYGLNVRVYGKNGTMGALEPRKEITAHELCIVFEVVARTQEDANTIASMTRHQALHLPIPEWSGLITGLACPYDHLERGPVFRFNIHHVVEPDDESEMFPMEIYHLDGNFRVRVAS